MSKIVQNKGRRYPLHGDRLATEAAEVVVYGVAAVLA
jgi:hypothetical protein